MMAILHVLALVQAHVLAQVLALKRVATAIGGAPWLNRRPSR